MRFPTRHAHAGFSLVELLVSLAVASLLLTGVLAAFNLNSRLARVQTQVADMQQSSRVSQYDVTRITRMTGRGGLPAAIGYNAADDAIEALALELRNNVASNTQIGGVGTPDVVEETDVLTVRGVFSSPIYQVDLLMTGPVDPLSDTGTLSLGYLSPSGVPQNMQPIADAVNAAEGGDTDALILVSSVGTDYAVVELTGGVVTSGGGEVVTVQLNFAQAGGEHTAEYLALTENNVFPPAMTRVAYVGLLEEYRYYVRDDPDGPSRLSRARFYPGTETPHYSNPTAQEDVADNVLDLQIAFGIDRNADGQFDDVNEWLWDDPDDDPTDVAWANKQPYYLRINTLARTNRPDPKYRDPAIDFVENREYDEPAEPTSEAEILARSHRRKLLRNTVDLRNLG